MFYFFIFSLVYLTYSTALWHHEVLLYGPSDSKSDRPELFMQQTLHQQINKKVVLEDGRIVQCGIALDPKVTMKPREEQNNSTKLQIQINSSVANMVFFQLKNQCAYHRTKEFLWEYCFKKYIRQFDDEQTVKNMQKKQYEEFFIGYSVSYDVKTNTSVNVLVPKFAEIPLRNSIQDSIAKNTLDEVALLDGYVVKLIGKKSKLNFQRVYQITLSITEDDYQQSSLELQQQINQSFTKYEDFYFKTMLIHQIVHSQLLILKNKFPFKMITHLYQISSVETRKDDTYSKYQTYLHKDLIYGAYLMAQYYFIPGMQVALIVGNKIQKAQVIDIIDTSLIQLDREFTYTQNISLFILDQKQTAFHPLQQRVIIRENILYIQDRNDQQMIQINDYIMILPNSTQKVSYAYQYKINRIFIEGIYILDKQFTEDLFYEGLALIAHQTKQDDKIQLSKNSNTISLITFKIQDESVIKNLFKNEWIILQSNSTKQRLIHPEIINNFKLQVDHINTNNHVFAFQYFLAGLKFQNTYEFHLKINLDQTDFYDIELIYFSNPTPTLISRQFETKGEYTTMDDGFMNRTLLDQLYWVVVDIQTEFVYVGQGTVINLANQMIKYQLKRKNQEQRNPNFIIVEILPLDSYGIKVNNFESLERIEYQSKKLPWILEGPSITTLNFSAYNMLDKIYNIKKEEEYQNEYTFFESYTHGSFCPPIQQDRSINVTLICDPQNFFRIIKVTEPKICQYKMIVGTKILCEDKDIVNQIYQRNNLLINTQRIMCVLQK